MNRIAYFDFLRGLAIIMVCGIHTWHITDFDSLQGIMSILLRQILNCAVPLFFSNIFCSKKKVDVFSFWKSQIPKVYIPALIWSLPWLCLNILNGGNVAKSIITYCICGFSIYYFIAVIIQYYILLPFLLNVNRFLMTVLSSLISGISIMFIIYLTQIEGIKLPLIVYAGHGDLWLVFFVLGIYLRYSSYNYSWKLPLLFAILFLVLQMGESYFLYKYNEGGFGIKLSSFIFSVSVILLLFHSSIVKHYSEKYVFVEWIRKIGQFSFGIYLIHCFFITLISHTEFKDSFWLIRWFLSISLSIIVIFISKKCLSPKINYYLGFY